MLLKLNKSFKQCLVVIFDVGNFVLPWIVFHSRTNSLIRLTFHSSNLRCRWWCLFSAVFVLLDALCKFKAGIIINALIQLYLDFSNSQWRDKIVRKIEGSVNRGIGKIGMCIEKKRLIFVFQPTFDEFSYLQGLKIICNLHSVALN